MPLEIKELVIRATIDAADPDRSAPEGRAAAPGKGDSSEEERRALIEAVTLADVNRVAAELLMPEALSVVVVGAPGDGFEPLTVIDSAALAAQMLSETIEKRI